MERKFGFLFGLALGLFIFPLNSSTSADAAMAKPSNTPQIQVSTFRRKGAVKRVFHRKNLVKISPINRLTKN